MNSAGVKPAFSASVDANEWDTVLESVSPEHQFLSHHWYDVWSRAYAANDENMHPVVYSSSVNSDATHHNSLFPCVLRSRFGIDVLAMAGYYYPFRTFLCPADARATAIDQFASMVHTDTSATVLLVGPLQVSDEISQPLQSSFQQLKWKVADVSAGAQQVVNLPATIEEYRTSLSKNLRKNHDRRKRSLEATGQFDITYFNNCTEEVWSQVIDNCAEIEANSWLAIDGDGKTRVHGRESFWKSYAAHEDGSKRLSIWVASLDEKPIAYSLAIDSGTCRYSISGQYDESFKKHGVGIIADMCMFEQGIESGKTVVNMGDGESDYKRRWGAEPGAELQSLYLFKPSVVGRLGFIAFRTLEKMRHSKLFYRLNRYF